MTVNPPISALTEPQPSDPIPDLVELVINGNIVSPSYWINYVLVNTIGVDPLSYTTNKIAGDWQALQKAGTALDNMAEYLRDYARTISTENTTVHNTWKGNAADAADDYFDELTKALNTQAGALRDISMTVEEYSLASYYMAQYICGKTQDIYDLAIILAIKQAAAWAMASTGVGAVGSVFTTASAVYEVAQIIKTWGEVLGQFTTWVFRAEAAIGVILGAVATVSSTDIPSLGGETYDHQGVS
ncbi:WXG100 family type VII secretion target [Nocardia puris]|uniref:Type VII secretion system (Wss) protein ESAT-6 n=1 Tax=Nocardia puris TaxID=208602 RepID=A0A366DJM9_9NOCA|nr:WXG100 family type VII secretion target [Nocardia puris]RBO90282.1 type VII secretion system (Wss) protein ESAT-6 [Nocardia puris]